MNKKIYENRMIDLLSAFIDVALIAAVVFFGMRLVGRTDINTIVLYAAVNFFVLNLYEVYDKTIRRKYELFLITSLTGVITCVICSIVTGVFRHIFVYYGIIFYIGILILEIPIIVLEKHIFNTLIIKIMGTPKLLVLETTREKNNFARKIKYSYDLIYDAWYEMVDDEDESEITRVINEEFKKFNAVFVSPHILSEVKYRLISEALKVGKEIYVLPDMYNISTLRSKMVQFDDTPALQIRQFALTRPQLFVKRLFDVLISGFLIILSSPIMAVIALLIKIDSKGPVIYKQERLTKNQKPFYIYKFRTMQNDAEKYTGAIFATDDDPRITRVGRVLRLSRLDELPQLFNILFGHMSVVGPRPERKIFIDEFLETIDNYDKRFFVKAGLTGLAQVYGKYQTQVKDKTLYDIMYIKEFSFLLDIKIIFLTIKVIFQKESSSGLSQPEGYETDAHESTILEKHEEN